jgi:hypothetical protein
MTNDYPLSVMRLCFQLLLLTVFILVAGCADDIRLRNAQTGHTAICKGGYRTTGLGGLVDQTAKELQMRCLDDYQRQGYERVGN